jgi:transposase
MQWLQDTKQSNVNKWNNVRHEACTHLRKKKRKHLKAKINELERNSTSWSIRYLYRAINNFKKGYQLKTNMVKNEKGDLVADRHSVLTRYRNHFPQLFNTQGVNDIRQTVIHTAEPLGPQPNAFGRQRRLLKS